MTPIIDQIRRLIEQGKTEQALQTLADWLHTQQTAALNEVILLRSRLEKVHREQRLNLISSEEAARTHSQINFALLNLLQQLERPTLVAPGKNRTILIAGALLLLAAVVILTLSIGAPNQSKLTKSSEILREAPSKRKAIQFPKGKKTSLTVIGSTVTYTLQKGNAEPFNTENQKITLKVRCYLHPGAPPINFWNDSFRLLVGEDAYAPAGDLNELVMSDNSKDGEVFFIIPADVSQTELKFIFYKEFTRLPLQW